MIFSHIVISLIHYGFRLKHSTIDALTEFMQHTLELIEKKEHSVSIFVDLSNTFDTLGHIILMKN